MDDVFADKVPGRAINVPESGNCFYTALIAALKQLGKKRDLSVVRDALGVESLTVKSLRERTPYFAWQYMGGNRSCFLKETFLALTNVLQDDVNDECAINATYLELLESLPQALAEKYSESPPASAKDLTSDWCACVVEYKTYACQIVVSSLQKALDDLCGVKLRLIMAASTDDAARMKCDLYLDAVTLIHVMDIEHYMWVGPKNKEKKAAKKRKRD